MRHALLVLIATLPIASALPTDEFNAVSWSLADPGPASVRAGESIVIRLVLVTHTLRLPSEITVLGADDAAGAVAVEPAVVETSPGRQRYPVTVTWRPAEAGARSIVVEASGAKYTQTLRVDPAEALLHLTPGNATADWRLPVTIRHAAPFADEAATEWAARWTDGNASLSWTEAGPRLGFAPAPATTEGTFVLRYGPGRYDLTFSAAGRLVAGVSPALQVVAERAADPEADAPVVAIVPDAPLGIALTADTVNTDGRVKRPGEELITRVRVSDGNGLGAVERVTFEVLREGTAVNVTDAALPADRWARTSLDLENRYASSPLAAGFYTMRAWAWTAAGPEVSASRTFVIRLVSADAGNVTMEAATILTDRPQPLNGTARILSKSWERPQDLDGLLQLRVYRGTTQVAWEAAAGNVTGSTPLFAPLAGATHDREGLRGSASLPIRVTVPAGVSGSYRVNLLWAANTTATPTSLASWSFTADAAPRITRLEALGTALPGQALPIALAVDPGARYEGVTVSLLSERVDVAGSAATINLSVPRGLAAGAPLTVLAEARAAGRIVATRELAVGVGNAPPEVVVRASLDGVPMDSLRILPGAARQISVGIAASDANGEAPSVESVALVDWTGRAVVTASPVPQEGGASAVLDLPANLAGGAYRLVARAEDAAGATAEAAVPALVGGWAAVRAAPTSLNATGGKLVGTLRVENVGTVALTSLALDLDGAGPLARNASLRVGSTVAAEGAPLALPVALAPGAALDLVVEVPLDARDPPGRYEGRLRVLAVPGAAGW